MVSDFEEMDFDELNNYAKYEGFTKDEINKIYSSNIIKCREREHLCPYCAKNRFCFIEAKISADEEHDYNQYNDIVECTFYEAKI